MTYPEVLEAVLTPKQREAGYWLREFEDDIVLYHHQGLRVYQVAVFPKGAKVEEIRAAADRHMEGRDARD